MNRLFRRGAGPGPLFAATLLAALVLPRPALASLGGSVATVETDRASMEGSRTVASLPGYEVHELKAATGTVVREFVSTDGRVFAVAWQGPFMPNLRQLLGDYFGPFTEAAQAQEGHRLRRPAVVRGPGFVVESGGHMRALFGRAYLPEKLPALMDDGGIR